MGLLFYVSRKAGVRVYFSGPTFLISAEISLDRGYPPPLKIYPSGDRVLTAHPQYAKKTLPPTMPTQTQNGGETVTRTGGTRGESVATTLQSGYILRGGYPRSNEISAEMRNVGPLKYTLIAATAAAEAKHSGRRSRRSCLFLTMEGLGQTHSANPHTKTVSHRG